MKKNYNNIKGNCKGFIQWGFGLEHDHDCGYNTTISCDDCKYGGGNKNPEAKCNQKKII